MKTGKGQMRVGRRKEEEEEKVTSRRNGKRTGSIMKGTRMQSGETEKGTKGRRRKKMRMRRGKEGRDNMEG